MDKGTMLSREETLALKTKVDAGEALTNEDARNLIYSALTNGDMHHRYYWGAMSVIESRGYDMHYAGEQEKQLKTALWTLREEAENKCAIRDETLALVESALASTRPGTGKAPLAEIHEIIEKWKAQLKLHNCTTDEGTQVRVCAEDKPCTMHELEAMKRGAK